MNVFSRILRAFACAAALSAAGQDLECFEESDEAVRDDVLKDLGIKNKKDSLSAEDFILGSDSPPHSKLQSLTSMAENFEKKENRKKAMAVYWKTLEIKALSPGDKAKAAVMVLKAANRFSSDLKTGNTTLEFYEDQVRASDTAFPLALKALETAATREEYTSAFFLLMDGAKDAHGPHAAEYVRQTLDLAEAGLDSGKFVSPAAMIPYLINTAKRGAKGECSSRVPGLLQRQIRLQRLPQARLKPMYELASTYYFQEHDRKKAREVLDQALAVEGGPRTVKEKCRTLRDFLDDRD